MIITTSWDDGDILLDRELGVCPRTGPPPGNAGASGLAL